MERPVALALLACFLVLGCTTAAEPGDSEGASGDCKTGTNAAWAAPAGAAFALPSGVTLAGDITGNVADGPCASVGSEEYGGDLLPACISLKNTGTSDVTVKLPAGLVFLAKDAATQNGIILQDHDLVVPAGQTKAFRFDLFCLNEHCLFGTKTTILTFGNVSNDAGILELVGLARGRKMTPSATSTASVFGKAIWDITGGAGLGAERKKQIADTPDGT